MPQSRIIFSALIVGIFFWVLYLLFQVHGIYGGDSGDLVTAAYLFGVPHPPGYPLYTLLGWIVSRLPWFTAAWRIALLSSLPHALTIVFVFLLTYRLTKKRSAALFSACILGGNYLFFLYSVTPEVFALLDMLAIIFMYLAYLWLETNKRSTLIWITLVFGLALTHHHMILFFVPAIAWVLWHKRLIFSELIKNGRRTLIFVVFMLFGLLPYFYIPIAARGNSVINWDGAFTWTGFIRLITRADYGSFVSGGLYGEYPLQRLLEVKAFGQFILTDITWIGIFLAVVGLIWLGRNKREFFLFYVISVLCIGPIFFFYASFPLYSGFALATFERFLLPSYTLLVPLIGMGMLGIQDWFSQLLSKYLPKRSVGLFRQGLFVVFLLYPLTLLIISLWRFWGIQQDYTADNMGVDILSSVPPGSILLLSGDTPLFITQYVRYARGERSDVLVLHLSRLGMTDYAITLKKNFPELLIPPDDDTEFVKTFIEINKEKFPVYSNRKISLGEASFWVPHGLVYELVSKDNLPTVEHMMEANEATWRQFHDPMKGILSRYNHLMLSEVSDVYAAARIEYGKILLRAGKFEDARRHFKNATLYSSDTQNDSAHTYAGLASLYLKDCQDALDEFQKARDASVSVDANLYLYEGQTYRDCIGDAARATGLFEKYDAVQKEKEQPLQK